MTINIEIIDFAIKFLLKYIYIYIYKVELHSVFFSTFHLYNGAH